VLKTSPLYESRDHPIKISYIHDHMVHDQQLLTQHTASARRLDTYQNVK